MSSNPLRDLEHKLKELSDSVDELVQEEDSIYNKLRRRDHPKIPKRCEHCNSVYGYEKPQELSEKDRMVLEERLDDVERERMEIESIVLDYLNDILHETIFEVTDINY